MPCSRSFSEYDANMSWAYDERSFNETGRMSSHSVAIDTDDGFVSTIVSIVNPIKSRLMMSEIIDLRVVMSSSSLSAAFRIRSAFLVIAFW